jgi:hypothetical protein
MVGYWIELAQKMAEAARIRVAEGPRRLETLHAAAATKSQRE